MAIVRTLPSCADARGPADAEDFRAGLRRGIEPIPGSASVTVGGDPDNTVDAVVAGTPQDVNVPQTTVPIL